MTLTLPYPVVSSQSPSLSPSNIQHSGILAPSSLGLWDTMPFQFLSSLPVILLTVLDQISQCRDASAVSLQTQTSSHSISAFRGLNQSHSFKHLDAITLIFIIFSLDLTAKFQIYFLEMCNRNLNLICQKPNVTSQPSSKMFLPLFPILSK